MSATSINSNFWNDLRNHPERPTDPPERSERPAPLDILERMNSKLADDYIIDELSERYSPSGKQFITEMKDYILVGDHLSAGRVFHEAMIRAGSSVLDKDMP